jgi:hypothetical protein
MKNTSQHLIAEVPRRQPGGEMTIGIDLRDVWSHCCKLNQDGEVVDRGRFSTTPKAIQKWFTDVPHARVAMEVGVHSIWISEQLEQLGHEVIVANTLSNDIGSTGEVALPEKIADDGDGGRSYPFGSLLGGEGATQ